MRVLEPMTLDFAALADGIRRNNLGIAAMRVAVEARFEDGRVVLQPTGQVYELDGAAPAAGWMTLEVVHWDDPDRTALRGMR